MDSRTSSLPPSPKRQRLENDGEDCIIVEEKKECFIVNPAHTQPDKELADVKNNQGNDFYSKNQFLTARNLYNEAIQLDSGNAIYYANRAAANMSLNELATILDDLEMAIKCNPSYLKAFTRMFNHLLSLGQLSRAEQVVERTRKINAKDKNQIEIELKRMQERIACIRNYQSLYQKSIDKRDHRDALHYIEQMLQICTHSQEMKLKKAEALACCLRHEQVIEIVDPILRRDTTCSEALFIRGLSLYYQDNVEKAKAHFQMALKLEPEHRKSIDMLKKIRQFTEIKEEGKTEVNNGNLDKAIELFQKALLIDPINSLANAKLHFNLSVVYRRQNKYDNAIKACTSAIELNPQYHKAYMKRGLLNTELKNWSESVADFELLYKRLKTRETKCALERAKLRLIQSRSARKDYYAILGIPKTANELQIRKAWRQKALEFHPDRNYEADDKQKTEHERMFKEVSESHECLKDPEKRKLYDSGFNVSNDQTFSMFGPEVFKKFGCEPDIINEFFKTELGR